MRKPGWLFEGADWTRIGKNSHPQEKKKIILADPLMDGVNEIFYFFYSIGPGAFWGIPALSGFSPRMF